MKHSATWFAKWAVLLKRPIYHKGTNVIIVNDFVDFFSDEIVGHDKSLLSSAKAG